MESTETRSERGTFFLLRAVVLVVVVPALLITGYAALSLQGHQEDFPSKPMQTWPIGVSSLILAPVLSWAALKPSRGSQLAAVALALVCFAAAWASFLL
jgi:hypothetical protein